MASIQSELKNELFNCLENGNYTHLHALLKPLNKEQRKEIFAATDYYDETLLHAAISIAKNIHDAGKDTASSLNCIQFLVHFGASLETPYASSQQTPLQQATREEDTWLMEQLLDRGAKINVVDKSDGSLLQISLEAGHTEGVAMLLSRGAHLTSHQFYNARSPLQDAISNNRLDWVIGLHAAGVEPAEGILNLTSRRRYNPLRMAQSPEMVDLLIALGVNIDERHPFKGDTPLHQAVIQKRATVVSALLTHGADTTILDKDGKTARDCAVLNGTEDTFDQHDVAEYCIVMESPTNRQEFTGTTLHLPPEEPEVIGETTTSKALAQR